MRRSARRSRTCFLRRAPSWSPPAQWLLRALRRTWLRAQTSRCARALLSKERGGPKAHVSQPKCGVESCAVCRGAVSPPCKVAQHRLICIILVSAVQGQTVVAVCSGANMNFDRLRLVAELADLGAHVRPRTPSSQPITL